MNFLTRELQEWTHSSEQALFIQKYEQAKKAVLAEDDIAANIVAPFLAKEAEYRQITTKELAAKVLSNFDSYSSLALKPISYGFVEPSYVVTIADDLSQVGNFKKAISLLQLEIAKDSNNYDAQRLLAHIYEFQKNLNAAVKLRKNMIKLDPFNQVNLLQLGEDYKYQGDKVSAKQIITLINAFAPNSNEAKQAQTDFGN
jgi:tetratricopeptide (TPR) repeat protein